MNDIAREQSLRHLIEYFDAQLRDVKRTLVELPVPRTDEDHAFRAQCRQLLDAIESKYKMVRTAYEAVITPLYFFHFPMLIYRSGYLMCKVNTEKDAAWLDHDREACSMFADDCPTCQAIVDELATRCYSRVAVLFAKARAGEQLDDDVRVFEPSILAYSIKLWQLVRRPS